MSNSISYAGKYAGELDKMIVQESKVGFLADNTFKARFSGARDVYLPELSMVGLGNYSRTIGYARGDATLTHTKYRLTQERSRQLFIDAQDADESGIPDLAGQMVGEYTRTKVIPEIDAYAISKLFTIANEGGRVTVYNNDSAVSDLLSIINSAEAAMEYDGSTSLVALVDPTMYNFLMTSPELQRFIGVSEFKQGDINMKVKNLNGCAIIPVGAARMRSDYIFDTGNVASLGGFYPREDALEVRALVLPSDGASLIKKVDKVDMFTPNEVVDRDGYVINFRLYYDILVKNSRKDTIFAIAE